VVRERGTVRLIGGELVFHRAFCLQPVSSLIPLCRLHQSSKPLSTIAVMYDLAPLELVETKIAGHRLPTQYEVRPSLLISDGEERTDVGMSFATLMWFQPEVPVRPPVHCGSD
jgi:hypothetical protein